MSIGIYNWARRFSFTELGRACKAAWRRDRKTKFIFLAVLILPPLLIFILSVVLPLWADPLSDFVEESAVAPAGRTEGTGEAVAAVPSVNSTSAHHAKLLARINALEIEQAFLQSRLQLATSDSIGLSIDLSDSIACIEIKGVQVRRCKITGFDVSGGLQRWRARREATAWLSTPFVLRDAAATLPKAPIRVQEAPSDTIEAREKAEEEIDLEKRDVYFILHFDKKLSLAVAQTQQTSAVGWLHRLGYLIERGWDSAYEDITALAHLKLPAGRVQIRLEMSREDAKAIYRALPPRAELALRL